MHRGGCAPVEWMLHFNELTVARWSSDYLNDGDLILKFELKPRECCGED